MIERPAREGRSEKRRPEYRHKKTFIPGKSENEGIQGILLRTRGTGWPHPSLDGEVGPVSRDLDEHNQTDILTWGLNLAPAFPIATRFSGLWEFVARYSGATVLDFHEVP